MNCGNVVIEDGWEWRLEVHSNFDFLVLLSRKDIVKTCFVSLVDNAQNSFLWD